MAFDKTVDEEFLRISDKTVVIIDGIPISKVDLSIYTEYEETVTLVYHALGLHGNMGFDHLFSDEIDGDPRYQRTIAAFSRIGATEASDIFSEAAAAYFPEAGAKRMKKSDRQRLADRLDGRFLKLEKEILKRLAKYIKLNKPI